MRRAIVGRSQHRSTVHDSIRERLGERLDFPPEVTMSEYARCTNARCGILSHVLLDKRKHEIRRVMQSFTR